MRIFFFLLVNIMGFFGSAAIALYVMHNTNISDLPPELRTDVWAYFKPGTTIAWILGGILSIVYLFIKNNARLLFLFLPVVVPLVYSVYIIDIFNLKFN